MAKFLDYNPLNGSWVKTDYSAHEDKITVTREEDVSGILELAKANRNSGLMDKPLGSFHMSKYCTLPNTVAAKMLQEGIDPYSRDPGMQKKFFKEIETKYPYLKHTNRKMA